MSPRLAGRIILFAASLLAFAPFQACAQLFRAYLAIDGNDANPCTLPQPCRLLPAALNAIASGGEIWMLDSANYNTGPVNVTKSVTILSVPGVLGSVVALGGNAINIATASVEVTLLNLNILPYPGNAGAIGVQMTGGAGLTMRNCSIANFSTGRGLKVVAAAQVTVIDSVFSNNFISAEIDGGANARFSGSHFADSGYGVFAEAKATGIVTTVAISKSTSSNNSIGFALETDGANSKTQVAVIDSVLESSFVGGSVFVNGVATNGTAELTITGTLIFGNDTGLEALTTGARILASGNIVANNTTAFHQGGSATFSSRGNNTMSGNVTDSTGTISAASTL